MTQSKSSCVYRVGDDDVSKLMPATKNAVMGKFQSVSQLLFCEWIVSHLVIKVGSGDEAVHADVCAVLSFLSSQLFGLALPSLMHAHAHGL